MLAAVCPATSLAGLIAIALACGGAADPGGALIAPPAMAAGAMPPPGRYECVFRYIRLTSEHEPDSLAGRHVAGTSDRLYGRRPVSHASEMCEIARQPGGDMQLRVPGQPGIPIRPLSSRSFLLLWRDRAEFHRVDAGTYEGEISSDGGVETVTLYYLGAE